jgi:putative addiction module killer protein
MMVRETETFRAWIKNLRDERAQSRVNIRVRRLSLGNFGDSKVVGEGVSELRIDYGPGYRVYCTRRGAELVILLAGGDKSIQERDVQTAKALAKDLED